MKAALSRHLSACESQRLEPGSRNVRRTSSCEPVHGELIITPLVASETDPGSVRAPSIGFKARSEVEIGIFNGCLALKRRMRSVLIVIIFEL